MSCRHEHHGSCGHGHSHDDDDHIKPGEGQQDLLYSSIDLDGVEALNELEPQMGVRVIKPYDQRLNEDRYLESDADDQLILRIPFTGSVRLRSLLLKCGPADQTPSEVHIYANRDIDFDSAPDTPPTQKLESIPQSREVVEFPLKPAKFPDVTTIHLFVPASQGAETSRIYYLGFKGEFKNLRREGPTNIIYEAAPSVKDHAKIPGTDAGANTFGHGQ